MSGNHNTRELELERNQTQVTNNHQLDALIEQSADQLIELAHTASRSDALALALMTGDSEGLGRLSEELGWTLLIQAGVESISIYGRDQQIKVSGGAVNAQMVEGIIKRESAHWEVRCIDACYVEAGAPILAQGEVVGALLLSEPLSNVMLRYKGVSGVDTGLLSDSATAFAFEFKEPIFSWNRSLVALTNPASNKGVIEIVSATYTYQDLKNGRQVVSYDDGTFVVWLRPVAETEILMIDDVSGDVAAAERSRRELIKLSLYLFFAAECTMLLLLWRPLNRLKSSAGLVPLLAEGGEGPDLDSDVSTGRSRLFEDESDLLRFTAVKLQSTMTSLKSELSQNATLLEDRGRELEQQRDLLDQLLNSVGAVIIILNERGEVELTNRTVLKLCGLSSGEIQGRPFSALLEGPGTSFIMSRIQDVLSGRLSEYEHEASMIGRTGVRVNLAWRHVVLYEFDASHRQVLSVALDVSARITSASELAWRVNNDALTGLYNRRRFEEEVMSACALSVRSKDPVAVVVIAIDAFSPTMKMLGRQYADKIVSDVASTLQSAARASDSLAYIDEGRFALLLRPIDRSEGELVVERYAKHLRTIYLQGNELCRAHFGMAFRNKEEGNNALLLERAEHALMLAQRQALSHYIEL